MRTQKDGNRSHGIAERDWTNAVSTKNFLGFSVGQLKKKNIQEKKEKKKEFCWVLAYPSF